MSQEYSRRYVLEKFGAAALITGAIFTPEVYLLSRIGNVPTPEVPKDGRCYARFFAIHPDITTIDGKPATLSSLSDAVQVHGFGPRPTYTLAFSDPKDPKQQRYLIDIDGLDIFQGKFPEAIPKTANFGYVCDNAKYVPLLHSMGASHMRVAVGGAGDNYKYYQQQVKPTIAAAIKEGINIQLVFNPTHQLPKDDIRNNLLHTRKFLVTTIENQQNSYALDNISFAVGCEADNREIPFWPDYLRYRNFDTYTASSLDAWEVIQDLFPTSPVHFGAVQNVDHIETLVQSFDQETRNRYGASFRSLGTAIAGHIYDPTTVKSDLQRIQDATGFVPPIDELGQKSPTDRGQTLRGMVKDAVDYSTGIKIYTLSPDIQDFALATSPQTLSPAGLYLCRMAQLGDITFANV